MTTSPPGPTRSPDVDLAAGEVSLDLSRRQVLLGAAALAGGLAVAPWRAWAKSRYGLPKVATDALAESSLVYISPLHKDGTESKCHGEVWFFEDEGAVVMAAAHDGWKVKAIESGRDRARVWVGDFGPVWRSLNRYRSAPTFLARAEIDTDPAAFQRLLASYASRYPKEWDAWKPRFEQGYAGGKRRVLRYTPIGA